MISGKTGFFQEYYLNLKNSHAATIDAEIEKIADFKNDYDRISYVDSLATVRQNDFIVKCQFEGKDDQLAAQLKDKGNQAFKETKWFDALVWYTKSLIAIPEDKGKMAKKFV